MEPREILVTPPVLEIVLSRLKFPDAVALREYLGVDFDKTFPFLDLDGQINFIHGVNDSTVKMSTYYNRSSKSAVKDAIDYGELDTLKLFLDNGFDINTTLKGLESSYTPLIYAVRRGKLTVIKFLLDHGADINATGETYQTPLNLAQRLERLGRPGYSEIAKLLKER